MRAFNIIAQLLEENNNYLYYTSIYDGKGNSIFDSYVRRFLSKLKSCREIKIQCTTIIIRKSDLDLVYGMSEYNNFMNKCSCIRYNYLGIDYFVYYFFDSNYLNRCLNNDDKSGLDISETIKQYNTIKNIVLFPKKLKILSKIWDGIQKQFSKSLTYTKNKNTKGWNKES